MADALCGPSNPLQSFQKHTSVDRTLQQDRLASRHSPSQGFRSSSSRDVGLLDPEFEAFQAGQTFGHPFAFQQPGFQPPAFQQPSVHPQTSANAPSLPAWATDFQRLHISSPSSQQHRVPQQVASGGWDADFIRQQPTPFRGQPMTQPERQHEYVNTMTTLEQNNWQRFRSLSQWSEFGTSYDLQTPATQLKGKERAIQEEMHNFDEAALEKAFEDAHADALAHQGVADERAPLKQYTDHLAAQDQLEGEGVLEAADLDFGVPVGVEDAEMSILNEQLNGSLLRDILNNPRLEEILYNPPFEDTLSDQPIAEKQQQAQEDRQQQQGTDDEELALTAGQLLDSVADNTTEKFKQSQFLALMRKLRDHEIRVEGERMVEVSTASPFLYLHTHDSDAVSQSYAHEEYVVLREKKQQQRVHNHFRRPWPSDDLTCKVFRCGSIDESCDP